MVAGNRLLWAPPPTFWYPARMANKIPPALPFDLNRTPRTRLIHRLGLTAVCALAVVAFGFLVHLMTWNQFVTRIGDDLTAPATPQISALRQTTDTPLVVFVGNSHFLRGVNAPALHQSMSDHGCPARVLVIAYAGLAIDEEQRILRSIFADTTAIPDLIVVPTFLRSINARSNLVDIDWRYLPQDLIYDGTYNTPDSQRTRHILLSRLRALAFLLVGYRRFESYMPGSRTAQQATADGYLTYGADEVAQTELVASGLARLESALAANLAPPWVSTGLEVEPNTYRRNQRRQSAIDASADVLFLDLPRLARLPNQNLARSGYHRTAPHEAYLNLNDARLVPQMLDPSTWQNPGHLSSLGANMMVEHLTASLCQIIAERP